MDDPRATAATLGVRVRRARHRRGLSQEAAAALAGVSDAAWSRIELGRGAGVSLRTWLAVAAVVGVELLASHVQQPPYGPAIERLVERGGWLEGGRIEDARWFDRAPRRHPGLGLELPAERAVIRVVPTLVDSRREGIELERIVHEVHQRTPEGRRVQGVLVVVRTTANVRALPDGLRRRSDGPWVRALRDPGAAMPTRAGLVWLAYRGTHLLPGA